MTSGSQLKTKVTIGSELMTSKCDQWVRADDEGYQRVTADDEGDQRVTADDEGDQRVTADDEGDQRVTADDEGDQRVRADDEGDHRARADDEGDHRVRADDEGDQRTGDWSQQRLACTCCCRGESILPLGHQDGAIWAGFTKTKRLPDVAVAQCLSLNE